MKKLLALLKAIVAFLEHPVVAVKNCFNGIIFRHYERAAEVQSDRTVIRSIKETIADAKLDILRAQKEEDEESRRFYAMEAVNEINEAIDDCKNLISIDEAHHYFGIIGRPKIVKWAALPTIALAVIGTGIGTRLAALFGWANNALAMLLLGLGAVIVLAIPSILFVTRVLFQTLLRIRISNLEALHDKIVGVKDEVFAES